jgi:DNA-binding response OmpR family regulator
MPNLARTLLVDDVQMFRELGQDFLSGSGPVDLASSASAAFQSADECPPAVVIADMHLPDIDGSELCRRFKMHPSWGSPRVVLLARPNSAEDHAEAVRAGADEVLFKPLERDALIASIRRLTDFDTPRGLPRAQIAQPVEITTRGQRVSGILQNVSRGGVLVNAPLAVSRSEEVRLRFSIDGAQSNVEPTAQVIWSRQHPTRADQMGLRFLEIDARTIEKLDQYISENYPRTQSLPA